MNRNRAVLVALLALLMPSCGGDPNSPEAVKSRAEEAAKAAERGKTAVTRDTSPVKKVPASERLTGAEAE